jgi:POT family proton-dependent oligopeptide transporter
MTRALHATSADVGSETWVHVDDAAGFVSGQKIDFQGDTGLTVKLADGKTTPLSGTYVVGNVDGTRQRLLLTDVVDRKPLATTGAFDPGKATVSTYRLVGPQYFHFFAFLMSVVGVLFIVVAVLYKEKTHVRDEAAEASA